MKSTKKFFGIKKKKNSEKKKKIISIRKRNFNESIENKIKLLLEEFYPPSKTNHYVYFFRIEKSKAIIYSISSGNGSKSYPYKTCFQLEFNTKKKEIYIENLSKCELNGRKNLTNIIKIAHRLNYKYINLYDVSSITYFNSQDPDNKCSISLRLYNILLNGRTWYNKYGFKSYNQTEQNNIIDEVRNTSFWDNIFQYSFNNSTSDEVMKMIFSDIINHIQKKYKINIHKLTKDVFKDLEKIREKLKTDDEKDIFYCTLSKILELFDTNLSKLDKNVTYEVK